MRVPVPEVLIEDGSCAAGQGYAESKWVAEQILYRASRESALRSIIARATLITGAPNGAWNTTDWVPAILRSGLEMGCLPLYPGVLRLALSMYFSTHPTLGRSVDAPRNG